MWWEPYLWSAVPTAVVGAIVLLVVVRRFFGVRQDGVRREVLVAPQEDDLRRRRGRTKEEKRDAYWERLRAKQREWDEQELKEREEIEALRAARRAEEDTVYRDTWRVELEVVDSGVGGPEGEETLVDYISKRKVVHLQEAAAYFHFSMKELLTSIEKLEAGGEISGVLDDRGKYICITQEEFSEIAAFIRRKGRCGLDDITRVCNQVIDLSPL